MKAILLTVSPDEAERILNGRQTVIIRKSVPKCELPIEVFLYCTKGTPLYTCGHLTFGQEVFDYIETPSGVECITSIYGKPIYRLNSKVVAKFTLREVDTITTDGLSYYAKEACLTKKELDKYFGVIRNSNFYHIDWGYAWYISDLVVFDKPKELGEFRTAEYKYGKLVRPPQELTRPPSVFQYVEVVE